jgi:hypothetical protein
MWASLKQKMGLPEGPVHAPERHLPTAPVKTTQVNIASLTRAAGG